MKNKKKFLKIAIDSPAAAGAGTLAKSLSKHYNLLYLDTGKIYRMIAFKKITQKKKFNMKSLKSIIKNLNLKMLQNNKLLSNEVSNEASLVAKNKRIRKLLNLNSYLLLFTKSLNLLLFFLDKIVYLRSVL